jgi:two-component system cell cycle sensor histidine kinase/response regulator CckA
MTRALIVEDSPTQAEQLRIILESNGFEVETAVNGEEALDRFHRSRFDMVITDILMPGISGYDVCRKIKAEPEGKQIPVILLTTLNNPMEIVQGLECGADNFITKPYAPDYLLARIRSILDNKRLRTDSKLKLGVEIFFLGRRFTISSDKEQILGLLISTFEDIVQTNRELHASQRELAAANAKIELYARQLEGKVRASEEKYRALMENALDAIHVLSPDGTILEANLAAETLVGRPRREQLGRSFLELIPAEGRDAVAGHFGGMLETGSLHESSSVLRSDGRTIPIEVSASRVDVGGEPLILAIVRDVSERRQLEEQFRQSQKMEAVGQLAGGIAHDFNNLLTAILGYAGLLATQAGQGSPLSESIGEIRKAGERAALLTQQLLAFSRRQVLLPEVLNLNGIVTEMENMLRRLIGEDVELFTTCASSLGRAKADRGQIEQVLMNLAVNARDAMPKGGKLTIETANVALDESYARDHAEVRPGAYVLLAVSDTGVGMDADTLSHMFEPFFTTKEKGKGTGLGLATVYGIVKQSGGHIWVYSELGRGTTFKVYLPRVEEAVPAAPPRSSSSLPTLGTETILLVEDEEAVRRLVRMVLEGKGYTVLEASGWQAALEIAGQQKTIHLVITDVVMPGVGGPELVSHLEAARPGIRVLYMSGYTDGAVVNHGLLESAMAFLQKPFTPNVLLRKVREVLSS